MTRPAATNARDTRRSRGFTVVELMVTVSIVVVLLTIAVPSMREFIARKRLEGIANELATDLRFLRATQLEQGGTVGIRFSASADSTCYILFAERGLGVDCDCARQPACTATRGAASVEIKTVTLPRSGGVALTAVDPALYLGTNGLPYRKAEGGNITITASVSSTLGGVIRVETNEVVRPSICSVSGNSSTLSACPPSTP